MAVGYVAVGFVILDACAKAAAKMPTLVTNRVRRLAIKALF